MVRSVRSPSPSSSQRSAPGSRPRSSKRQPVDVLSLLPAIEQELARSTVLRSSDLTGLGVPRAQHEEALTQLQARGYEVQGTSVRVALAAQARRLLAEQQMIAAEPGTLKELVNGAKQSELKVLIEQLVTSGDARLVVRGKRQFLALPRFELVAGEALGQLRMLAEELEAECRRALGNRPAAALFRYDVQEKLQRLQRAAGGPAREEEKRADGQAVASVGSGPVDGPADGEVLEAMRQTVNTKVGMSFVPDTVQRLEEKYARGRIHEVMLAMARRRVIELQAEAGLGRFSREEIDRAPPGPRGFSLVWGRPLEETR